MNEYDLTKADMAQNRVINRLEQRLDSLEKQLAPLAPLAAKVGKHEALLAAINTQIEGVTEFLNKVHETVQGIETGPLEVFKTVKNFVDELMQRVAKVEQSLAPVRDALEWLQAHKPQA